MAQARGRSFGCGLRMTTLKNNCCDTLGRLIYGDLALAGRGKQPLYTPRKPLGARL